MRLPRRSTAAWRSCRQHVIGSLTGSCKQSLQDVQPSPVEPDKGLLSSNGRRSILTRSNGTRRNCVVSGVNWPLATTRDLRLAGSIFSVRSNYRRNKQACRGRSGPRPALLLPEKESAGRKEFAWRTLQATHAKFREGLETSDLRLAKQVLNGSYRRDSAINLVH